MAIGAAHESSAAGVVAAPLTVSYLTGGPNSHFEAGLGMTLATGMIEGVEGHEDEAFSGAIGTGILG